MLTLTIEGLAMRAVMWPIYAEAIETVGAASGGAGPEHGHGVSVKLSALCPRYEAVQEARVWEELYPRVKALALIAARHDLNFAIDAEEADRLVLSLKLVEALAHEPELGDWRGLGVVVHMAVLAVVLGLYGEAFAVSHYPKEAAFIAGQTTAALVAMTFNFVLNNELTYSDKRLRGFGPLVRGWAQFALTCSLGLLTNIGSSTALVRIGFHEVAAAVIGIVLGSVWNFALSSKFVWGKY